MSIFVTSDLHFGHSNIIKFCNRPFANVEEMNEALIDNINSKVGVNDELYHLGDFAFLHFDDLIAIRKQIKCRNLHMILGNHDKPHYFHNEHFTSVAHFKELRVAKMMFSMFHYPMLSWNYYYSNHSYQLHGHNHAKLYLMEVFENMPDSSMKRRLMGQRRMDVGVDNVLANYYPFTLDEIIDIMSQGKQGNAV